VHWSDVLKAALSIFLILTGVALAYLFLRMAGVFERLGISVTRVTDEVVPILNKAQTTMDGVNREIDRVDEIMVTAVNGAKGAERTIQTISHAATGPVRVLTGVAAGVKEGLITFVARRVADAQQSASDPPPDSAAHAAGDAAAAASDAVRSAADDAQKAADAAAQTATDAAKKARDAAGGES
jgi:CTP synthase (UTP-ammonia lyase)